MSATVLTLEIAAANLRAARIARRAEFLRQWIEIKEIKLVLADGLSPREVARTLHTSEGARCNAASMLPPYTGPPLTPTSSNLLRAPMAGGA